MSKAPSGQRAFNGLMLKSNNHKNGPFQSFEFILHGMCLNYPNDP